MKQCSGFGRTGLIFTGIREGTQLGGLTQHGQTEQCILYRVPSCWVLVGGAGRQEGSRGWGVRGCGWWWELLSVFCCLSCVFSLSVLLLLLFPLFAVLLNCPYPDPPTQQFLPVSFLFSSAPRLEAGGEGKGGKATAWCFCCRPQLNYNKLRHCHECHIFVVIAPSNEIVRGL